MTEQKPIIIGLDFGGVLSKLTPTRSAEHIDTNINMDFAIEVLTKLKATGKYSFRIISYCGYHRAVETAKALADYAELFDEIYFVKDRMYKGELCKYLGCHMMVDDRAEILNDVRQKNRNITTVIFGKKRSYPHKHAMDWNQLFELIEHYKPLAISPDTTVDITDLVHNVN